MKSVYRSRQRPIGKSEGKHMRSYGRWRAMLLAALFVGLAACEGEPAKKKGKYRFDPTTAEWSAEETRGP